VNSNGAVKPSTFSIVAYDREVRQWGVAVQSKFLAVGSVVPWAEAGVGAVATQAAANTRFGPDGLSLLRQGLSAPAALDQLIAADPERDHRQVGIIDHQGRAAVYTGKSCYDWAGHLIGPGFTCQGNILVSRETVQAMGEAFQASPGPLAQRLLRALQAGQDAGGDRRGQQSAALLIVQAKGGYGGFTDRLIDLRVDDHPQPMAELARLLDLQQLYFGATERTIALDDGETVRQIQTMLKTFGHYRGKPTGRLDAATLKAIEDFHNIENLEMRRGSDPNQIDAAVFQFMNERYQAKPKAS